MQQRSVESVVEALVAGEQDASEVPLASCVEVAEGLANRDEVGTLAELAARCLPRLVKKDRDDEVEALWVACCTAGALPVEVMLHAAGRIAARGRADRAAELFVMLVEALAGEARHAEAVSAAEAGLAVAPRRRIAQAAWPALRALYPDAAGADETEAALLGGPREASAEALGAAERRLRHAPGTFIQLEDYTVALVAANDGSEARLRHPSGSEETRRIDGQPPPKVLPPTAHEVLRLFRPDELRRAWLEEPVSPLGALLDEQGGTLTVAALRAILVPHLVPEHRFDEVLARLQDRCGGDDPVLPAYDTRRRIFVAPGCSAPPPARRVPKERVARTEESVERLGAAPPPSPSTVVASTEQPRWVDLTGMPEIRALIGQIEREVDELTRELNVDLPARLEEARAHGDLRENAEYDAAKERLRFVQARIEGLRARLGGLHDLSRIRLIPGKVTVMSRVTLAAADSGDERTLRITPAELPDPRPGDVSAGTPYGRALLGHEQGDVVAVRLPRRTERYEVVRVVDPDEA